MYRPSLILTSGDFPCQRKFSEIISEFSASTAKIKQTLNSEIAKSQNRVAKLERNLEEAASRFDIEISAGKKLISGLESDLISLKLKLDQKDSKERELITNL